MIVNTASIEKFCQDLFEEKLMPPVWLKCGEVHFVDQRRLPHAYVIHSTKSAHDIGDAISAMIIRGSGALGISAAYGMLLAYANAQSIGDVRHTAERLASTRPMAKNLVETTQRLLTAADAKDVNGRDFSNAVLDILIEQLEMERSIGRFGNPLIRDGAQILTHCHSGALAGSGYGGRAISSIRCAHESGKKVFVYISETRPYFQGSRITAFELDKLHIPYSIISDGMSGQLMQEDRIDCVIVGSDRVMQNGDLFNKAGTYMHALAAHANDVPFYVGTSAHTIDLVTDPTSVKPEVRPAGELIMVNGVKMAPDHADALYISFDRTPARLINAYITEKGIIQPPYDTVLRRVFGSNIS